MTFSRSWPYGHLIGDTGRKARIIGEAVQPRDGLCLVVLAEDGCGGSYREIYRLDGSWPFNEVGNFDLRDAPASLP